MGLMRFLVPRRELLAADAVERAYLAGIDEIPWLANIHWTEDGLVVERDTSDSGNFYIPCPVEGRGELVLSTASLMERSRPYLLHVELARGTLNRLRNQMSGWDLSGLTVPQNVREAAREALSHFGQAVTRQNDPPAAVQASQASLLASLHAIDLLTVAFAEQVLVARHQQGGKFNTLLGVDLGAWRPGGALATLLPSVFNTALVPMVWRDIEPSEGKRDWSTSDAQIEWCRAHGFKICAGPLLSIDKWSLPDWMYLWGEEDEDNFRACVAEHIQEVVSRYRGKVHLWQCAARLNIKNDFGHGEEQRLRLAVLAMECIRRVDPRTPVVISVDLPWAGFMGREEYELSPWHFADALVRAELGLAGIGLEINFGYSPHGTEPRDVLEFGRQLDRFGTLGLPLLVTLSVPSASGADPRAARKDRIIPFTGGQITPATQQAWAEQYLPALLARQPVQGIIWNQLLDSQPHAYPHGGLFDAQDRPKPLVEYLQSLRKLHFV